jgi:hypothetical protein
MTEQTEVKRGPGRPPNSARAEQRPAQRPLLRTPGNRFDVPYSLIAKYPDMSFEWKVQTVNEQVRTQAERLGQASRQQVGAKHTKLNRSVVEIPDD